MSYSRTVHQSEPVARRKHECSDCERIIEPGEHYSRGWGLWEDEPYTWKWCAHCRAAVGVLRGLGVLYDDGEGVSVRQHVEAVVDYRDAQSLTEIRLAVCFRRKWRRRDGSLMPVPADSGEVGR